MEHIDNPEVLAEDLVSRYHHLHFSVYGIILRLLRSYTGLSFATALDAGHYLISFITLCGVYLMARGSSTGRRSAILAVSIFTLSAYVAGPRLFTIEPETIPRGCALAFAILALGCLATRHSSLAWASVLLACLLHPLVGTPVAVVLAILPRFGPERYMLRRTALRHLLSVGIYIMLLTAFWGLVGREALFHGISLTHRMNAQWYQIISERTPYVLISRWQPLWIADIAIAGVISLLCVHASRLRLLEPTMSACTWTLVCFGLLSLPVSFTMLEYARLAVTTQIQPLRLTLWSVVLLYALGPVQVEAMSERRPVLGWLLLYSMYLLHCTGGITTYWLGVVTGKGLGVVGLMCAISALAVMLLLRLLSVGTLRRTLSLCGVLVVNGGVGLMCGLVKGSHTHGDPAIVAVAAWAAQNTEECAVFGFPDAVRSPAPGLFRATARRAVYVDYKSGGQGNYFEQFAVEWGRRWAWQRMGARSAAEYAKEGVDYIVVYSAWYGEGKIVYNADNMVVVRVQVPHCVSGRAVR